MRKQVFLVSLILLIYTRASLFFTFSLLLLQLSLHRARPAAGPRWFHCSKIRQWISKVAVLISSSATFLLAIQLGLYILKWVLRWISIELERMLESSAQEERGGLGCGGWWIGGRRAWDWKGQVVMQVTGMAVMIVEMVARDTCETYDLTALEKQAEESQAELGDRGQRIQDENLNGLALSTITDDAFSSTVSHSTCSPPKKTKPELETFKSPRSRTRKQKYDYLNESWLSGGGSVSATGGGRSSLSPSNSMRRTDRKTGKGSSEREG